MGMDVEEEEEEVLFPPSYYVQSPSTTISNTPSFEFQHTNQIHIHDTSKPTEASRRSAFSSSRCSSTRESLMSNALDNKSPLVEINGTTRHQYKNVTNSGTIVSSKRDDDDDDDVDSKIDILGRYAHDHEKDGYEEEIRSRGFRKYLSFGTYDSSVWLAIQLSWRFMVSLAAALLVFYLVTKPPSPRISVKVGGVMEFELAEGVDGSGVSTKIMRCNTSIQIAIDNHSKVFGLHILPPHFCSFSGGESDSGKRACDNLGAVPRNKEQAHVWSRADDARPARFRLWLTVGGRRDLGVQLSSGGWIHPSMVPTPHALFAYDRQGL